MRAKSAKLMGLLFAAAVLLAAGWLTGYYSGFIEGQFSVYNLRYREQRSEARRIISGDSTLSSLEIHRFGDGNVILKGEIDEEALRRLESDLTNWMGTMRSRLAISELQVIDRPVQRNGPQ